MEAVDVGALVAAVVLVEEAVAVEAVVVAPVESEALRLEALMEVRLAVSELVRLSRSDRILDRLSESPPAPPAPCGPPGGGGGSPAKLEAPRLEAPRDDRLELEEPLRLKRLDKMLDMLSPPPPPPPPETPDALL
jgi:hypothetical protein